MMMAKKKPTNENEAEKPNNVVQVALRYIGDTPDAARAWTLSNPEVQAAATIQNFDSQLNVNAIAIELSEQVKYINGGNMHRAEAMLVSQAHTLDKIFNHMMRSAKCQSHLLQYETYMRLALKAQSQCRATLESLAKIKNPPIVYAKQANFASGPQQVNNGAPLPVGKNEIEQSKLLTKDDYATLDSRRTATPIGANQELEAVGAIHRAEDRGGAGQGVSECLQGQDAGGTEDALQDAQEAEGMDGLVVLDLIHTRAADC